MSSGMDFWNDAADIEWLVDASDELSRILYGQAVAPAEEDVFESKFDGADDPFNAPAWRNEERLLCSVWETAVDERGRELDRWRRRTLVEPEAVSTVQNLHQPVGVEREKVVDDQIELLSFAKLDKIVEDQFTKYHHSIHDANHRAPLSRRNGIVVVDYINYLCLHELGSRVFDRLSRVHVTWKGHFDVLVLGKLVDKRHHWREVARGWDDQYENFVLMVSRRHF